MNIINIKNLNFKYNDKKIFENLNLQIKENTITTILGKNGSGKSTLINLIKEKYSYEGKIHKNHTKKIGIVSYDNIKILGKTINEHFNTLLTNLGYGKRNIKNKISELIEKYELSDIIDENYNNLTDSKKQIINLISELLKQPSILLIDEIFNYMDYYEKENIFNILLQLKNDITIVIFTTNIEDSLISDEILVLGDKKIVLKGNKEKVYKEEKTLNNLGFKLPFMVELSNRLKFYNLIDETIYDMQKMVDTLWK